MLHKLASIPRILRLTAVCVLCNQYHHEQLAICNPCLKLFIPLKYACSICRVALPSDCILQCGYCSKQKPTYDQVLTAYAFEEPLRTLIHQFKYYKALYLSTLLVKFMLDALPSQTYRPDCFIPIPLHPKRLYNRGFNQSVILAKLLSKYLNIPIDLTLLHKIINTPPQATLSRKQRHQNLKASFIAKSNRYQHVTIIDDLITTGNTANEVAKLLKKQHVQRVDVWCIARASIDSI
ncbi:ComF family protein [Legionella gresilensis]|uniref:ComF family protein n=1 Tax=Legionella gresilensis TaxID=91823 RepID=UPI0010417799|nr:ComF family protein [Legionella gresilensis]